MRLPRGAGEAVLAFLIALGTLALFAAFANAPAVRRLQTASIDLRFRWRGPLPPGDQISVVLVDDASLEALGRWPLSRHLFAKAVTTLAESGAKAIVFDILFPDREGPIDAAERQALRTAAAGQPDPTQRQLLERLADDDPDGDLAMAIRHAGNVLLPFSLNLVGPPREAPDFVSSSTYQLFEKSRAEPAFTARPVSITAPIEPLATAAAGLVHVAILYDVDGVPRYNYAALPFDGDVDPSLAVRAAADYLGVPWTKVGLALGSGIDIGPVAVPTDRAMRFLVNYRGPPGTFPTWSFIDLLRGKVPAEALKHRIVILGGSFLGNADTSPSPFGQTPLPGAEWHADAISTILDRAFITKPGPGWWFGLRLLVLTMAMSSAAATALVSTRIAILAILTPVALWTGGAQLAFDHGSLIPMAGPLLAFVLAGGAVMLFRYWVTDQERRVVRAQFRRYLAPQMVDLLARDPSRLRLGGETRVMTYLFCDVRGFTTISEQYKARPQDLTLLINRFLTPMTDIIMARGGTIDKYMGDCIMAFWNAPLDQADHATLACESALAMMGALAELNRQLAAEAATEGRGFQPLRVGVGLNTGPAVVGNVGSDQRFDYSVIGDAVNLASRLEGQSKTYGVDIVIGEETQSRASAYATLELDLIAVKGKHEPVRVFALLGDETVAASPDFTALRVRHERLIALYRSRQWAEALETLAACEALATSMRVTYELYRERIGHFLTNPVGADWDGVFSAKTK